MSTENCHPSDEEMTELITIYCIQGFYGFFSIIIYILNIQALRHFKNNLDKAFSLLYICCAILSIVYFLDHFLVRRFLKLGYFCESVLELFGEPNYVLNPYKTVASYCPIAILVFHFLIAAHRFSIVFEPMSAVQKWEKYRRLICIIGFIIPLFFMGFMIPCKSYAEVDSDGTGGLDIEYKKVVNLSSSLFASISAITFGVLTLLLTLGILVKLAKSQMRKITSAEISLIVFEVFMTVFTMVYALTEGLLYYSIYIAQNTEMKSKIIQHRNFAIDVFILPQAWTLLFLSKTVRRYTLRLISNQLGIEFQSTQLNQHNNSRKITRIPSTRLQTISLKFPIVL